MQRRNLTSSAANQPLGAMNQAPAAAYRSGQVEREPMGGDELRLLQIEQDERRTDRKPTSDRATMAKFWQAT